MKYVVMLLLILPVIGYGQRSNSGRWLVTSQRDTLSVIQGPVTFLMGSPADEKYRADDELQHPVTIPRGFAIGTREITVSQFQKFLQDNPSIRKFAERDPSKSPALDNKKLLIFSPDADCPQIYVTWY